MPLWTFTSLVSEQRARALLRFSSFDEVLSLLPLAEVTSFRWKGFDGQTLAGCHRAEFGLSVHPDVYDAFFNAPAGLRAQYALSPHHGEAATRRSLLTVLDRLMSFHPWTTNPSSNEVLWSLCATEAKVWIDEYEVEKQLGGIDPSIQYVPWQENSETGVGLLAPRGNRLRVKGGWIDPDGIVRFNPLKLRRSEELHREGFS